MALASFSWKNLDDGGCSNSFACSNKFVLRGRRAGLISDSIKKMQEKWHREINLNFKSSNRKSHLEISGGNTTFCFVLPSLFQLIQKAHVHIPLALRLCEHSDGLEAGVDIVLAVAEMSLNNRAFFELKDFFGYKISRKFFDDRAYLCASAGYVGKFGRECALKSHYILSGRMSHDLRASQYVDKFYSYKPEGREDDIPRIISDQYFMSCLFMKHSAGIWQYFASCGYDSNLSVISDSNYLMIMKRFFAINSKLDKKFNRVIRKGISLLENRLKNSIGEKQ